MHSRHPNAIRRAFSLAVAVTATAFAAVLAPTAKADTAISFDPGSGSFLSGQYTLGWTFTPTTGIWVTDIGWYDHNTDGLLEDHVVNFWDAGSMAIAGTGTVTALGSALDGEFRYITLGAPVFLNGGTTYVIGGSNDLEDYAYSVTGMTTSPYIVYGENRYEAGVGPVFPTNTFLPSEPGYFGPNFKFQAVPEPGTYAMGAGMVLSALLAFRRRRTV